MSEYTQVEQPFLFQLKALGWNIIDQGDSNIPQDPALSCRTSFRELVLKSVFKENVRSINRTEDGQEWLTDRQLEALYDELTTQPDKSLLESNQNVLELLFKASADRNESTGEEDPVVKIIDFQNPLDNHFLAVNQFRIDTPGGVKPFIIPDIVLFVNGIPLAIVECKLEGPCTANPMYEAYKQLRRYSDQRVETAQAGLREGESRLFHFNQIMIRTCGDKADFGSISSTDEYYFPWKDIYPEKYREYTLPLGEERQQEVLIQGMLPPETLLDIIRNYTIYMEIGKQRVKVVCRYQQYRAACKIIERLRQGNTPEERSGVVWHTQGSGKSLTMVFVIRKLRSCEDLKDFKVLMVNDRTDLEEQLGSTASLTGEKVRYINSRADLKSKLKSTTSDLNMVMIHKFVEPDDTGVPIYLRKALHDDRVPKFKPFGVVNRSDRIIILIDEAHRTHYSDMGDNLFKAFPNATRIAFTGTPLIIDKSEHKTAHRFGDYIDKYKLMDAVDDGATIQILYEGKTAEVAVKDKHGMDSKFEDMIKNRSDAEVLAIKKRYGATSDILEAEARIEGIAEDIVSHYINNILPNGFKAQVVTSSKLAAVRYKRFIDQALTSYIENAQTGLIPDHDLIQKIRFLKSAVIISSEGVNERAEITNARKEANRINAVSNFKKRMDTDAPYTGIAFLIVCDMLLTGFDAPIEQVMYIDKKVQGHNLLQTIARVNRRYKGKSRGLIVDYIGLANHLSDALSIYAGDDLDDAMKALRDLSSEIPILEARYYRLINMFKENGITDIEDFVQQRIPDKAREYEILESIIETLEDIKRRADFEVMFKNFMQSMDIILPHTAATQYYKPARRFGFILAMTKNRYKDDSLDISGAGEKVKRLINEHLVSLGINPSIKPVELMSGHFIHEVEKKNKTSKAKASEMEHAIRKHCKVHQDEDPALYDKLSERLESLIQKFKDDWDQLCQNLKELTEDVKAGRKDTDEGVSKQEAPFYDHIIRLAFKSDLVPEEHRDRIQQLVRDIISDLQETIGIINFWKKGSEVKTLRGKISDNLMFSGIDEITGNSDKITTEIMAMAKARHQELVGK